MKKQIYLMSLTTLITSFAFAQSYSFEDFVGTWHGYISSEHFGGYNDPMTMTIEPDGFYTETSGHLMPTIYPNTQECDYQESTNRMHWSYLKTVYSGQYFYEHFFYEVVYFQNDTLEMHYNFWDDPEPHPDAGTIYLVKDNPVAIERTLVQDNIEKQLVRSTDILGREIHPESKGQIVIFHFSDGSIEKKYRLEY